MTMTVGDKKSMTPFTVVTPVQLAIAKTLYKKWTTPYLKPPMKPIGQEVDLDREDNNFVDISNCDYHILIPDKMMPMPSYCREKCNQSRPTNWSAPPMDSPELERLKFQMKGVHLPKTYKQTAVKYWYQIDKDLPYIDFQSINFTEYKWIGEQPIQEGSDIQPYDLRCMEREGTTRMLEEYKLILAADLAVSKQREHDLYCQVKSLKEILCC
jgi:hypothetical protein